MSGESWDRRALAHHQPVRITSHVLIWLAVPSEGADQLPGIAVFPGEDSVPDLRPVTRVEEAAP